MSQSHRGPQDRVPQDGSAEYQASFNTPGALTVRLPGGGDLNLLNPAEVKMWNETRDRYVSEYGLTKQNDLILLGGLLSQVLVLYRAQMDLANAEKAAVAQAMIGKCAAEIRSAEKALGIDKATRERGGQHNISDYLKRLKRAAHEKGVHISARVKAYEDVCMGARWRIRLHRNGDMEDKAYHGVETPEKIIAWLEAELGKLEEADKEWAREKGAIWVGQL
jgi:hypothetical protein